MIRDLFRIVLKAAALGGVGIAAVVGADSADAATIRHRGWGPHVLNYTTSVGYIKTGIGTGSGVLIGTQFLLTAAHVVDKAQGMTFTIGGQSYSAQSWRTAPTWNGDPFSGTDIAVVKLSQAVTNARPATLFTGAWEQGQASASLGYGKWSNGLNGHQGDNNGRWLIKTTNTIDHARGGVLWQDFDAPGGRVPSVGNQPGSGTNRWGSAEPLEMKGLISYGDSGGGLFIWTNRGWQARPVRGRPGPTGRGDRARPLSLTPRRAGLTRGSWPPSPRNRSTCLDATARGSHSGATRSSPGDPRPQSNPGALGEPSRRAQARVQERVEVLVLMQLRLAAPRR